MHNWYELCHFGRQRADELHRSAEELRPASSAGARRSRAVPAARAKATLAGGRATIVLTRGETASLRIRRRPLRIRCVAGQLWATVDGRAEDLVLQPGNEATIRGRGVLVVEALRTATVTLESVGPVRLTVAPRVDLFQLFPSPRVSAASQPRIAFFR